MPTNRSAALNPATPGSGGGPPAEVGRRRKEARASTGSPLAGRDRTRPAVPGALGWQPGQALATSGAGGPCGPRGGSGRRLGAGGRGRGDPSGRRARGGRRRRGPEPRRAQGRRAGPRAERSAAGAASAGRSGRGPGRRVPCPRRPRASPASRQVADCRPGLTSAQAWRGLSIGPGPGGAGAEGGAQPGGPARCP